MLTVGSCFSGIGGLELGLEWTGQFETKWQIEIGAYPAAVLAAHWPNVKRYSDIRAVDTAELERVDVICGGYPCQPFSYAGKRGGETDPRHLWPDMLRIIRELRPRIALLENVPGHLSMGFGRVLGDLAECGYDAEWQVLSAAGVGAPHLRRRVFILAHAASLRRGQGEPIGRRMREGNSEVGERGRPSDGGKICNPASAGLSIGRIETMGGQEAEPEFERSDWWKIEPGLGRMAHGVPSRVDRLKCLGNAVVPQVAQKVGEIILQFA